MNPAEESRKRRNYDVLQSSNDRSISPPPKRHATTVNHIPEAVAEGRFLDNVAAPAKLPATDDNSNSKSNKQSTISLSRNVVQSPVQLNFIEELPASSNVDCISLGSILGDPMIKECWLFNYLFDIDFVMRHFDPDTRDLVQVRVVHGSWKREDPNGIHIEEASKRYPNIKVIKAYMPEMFGTHHTKAIVLFRHDDLAQVVILTANFIERDFRMSQAIWGTPLLPLQKDPTSPNDPIPPLGSGARFKHDLLAYFRGYSRNGRTAPLKELISQLQNHNFNAVRGALIGSVPGLQKTDHFVAAEQDLTEQWGLPALKRILSCIPTKPPPSPHSPISPPQLVIQVSSIASFSEKWLLSTLLPTLSTTSPTSNPLSKPHPSIIFPTAHTIRHCLDGYSSGGSIHMKTSTPSQIKQLSVLKPMLHHWSSPSPTTSQTSSPDPFRKAGRGLASPHIKTYIRFSTGAMTSIDWAMMTSANLSTQAWGSPNASGEVKVCSYELGVVVWPALWEDERGSGSVRMVPVFGGDMPDLDDQAGGKHLPTSDTDTETGVGEAGKSVTVGWRMPYDLPLIPYGEDEKPWCATEACDEPDWMGRVWPGYGH